MNTSDIFESSDSGRSGKTLPFAKKLHFSEPLQLESGGVLPEITVAYETYGQLNSDGSNAVLICHALSGDSHVAAHNIEDDPGWWDILVGPGKPVDTDKYFVVCPNVLGGCRGTTGPDRLNPATNKPYGAEFPTITIGDIVEVQRLLADELGIRRFLAIIGGSLGGLMTLEWAIRFPDRIAGAVAMATCGHVTSQALAFDIVARNAIQSDPHFHGGQYYDKGTVPATGLAIARMLGHITYLSKESMQRKFSTDRNTDRHFDTTFETKFSVGSYLAYQGNRFVERFDANSYLALSMAIDTYELGETREKLAATLRQSMCRWLILSFTSDWLFPPFLSQELVDALLVNRKRVNYCNIQSDCGHDAFLLKNDFDRYGEMIRAFLDDIYTTIVNGGKLFLTSTEKTGLSDGVPSSFSTSMKDRDREKLQRFDYDRIVELIPPEASVLDLGCGSGKLLARLRSRGNRRLLGVEIDEWQLLRTIRRGIDVVQMDLNGGLGALEDNQFDFVVLSKTLQTIRDVDSILTEMLRVGTRCIVSFPNLGFHEYRRQLAEEGRSPKIDPALNRHWHDTHDVRFLTITDFEDYCETKEYRIHERIALETSTGNVVTNDPNRNADMAIIVLSR